MDSLKNIDLGTVVARSDSLLYSHIEGDVTMLSVETGKYYGLTKVGARIWSLLEQPISAEQVCRQLTTEYRVDPNRCEGDVLNIFRRMAEEGIVTVVAPTPGAKISDNDEKHED
jgi:hypothetical protein